MRRRRRRIKRSEKKVTLMMIMILMMMMNRLTTRVHSRHRGEEWSRAQATQGKAVLTGAVDFI